MAAMPRSSAHRLLVLHGLRLAGPSEPEAVGAIVGLPAEAVATELGALAAEGLAVRRDGRLAGWFLTPPGRAEQERLLAAELDATGTRVDVEAAYREFIAHNGDLLAACTDWQLRHGALNDHTDPSYDAAVVARLGDIHRRLLPVLDRLEAALDRYRGYRARFEAALARVRAGEREWFDKPGLPSYHTVWFQLHEDLLNTLGRERTDEPLDLEPAGAPEREG